MKNSCCDSDLSFSNSTFEQHRISDGTFHLLHYCFWRSKLVKDWWMKSGNKQRFSVISPSENRFSKSSSSSFKFPFTKIELYKTLYIISNDNACFSCQQQLRMRSSRMRLDTRTMFVVIFGLSFLARELLWMEWNSEILKFAFSHHFSWESLSSENPKIHHKNGEFNKIKCIGAANTSTKRNGIEVKKVISR